MATRLRSFTWRASMTTPIPPLAMHRTTLYFRSEYFAGLRHPVVELGARHTKTISEALRLRKRLNRSADAGRASGNSGSAPRVGSTSDSRSPMRLPQEGAAVPHAETFARAATEAENHSPGRDAARYAMVARTDRLLDVTATLPRPPVATSNAKLEPSCKPQVKSTEPTIARFPRRRAENPVRRTRTEAVAGLRVRGGCPGEFTRRPHRHGRAPAIDVGCRRPSRETYFEGFRSPLRCA